MAQRRHLGMGVEERVEENRKELGNGAHERLRHAIGEITHDVKRSELTLPIFVRHPGDERRG